VPEVAVACDNCVCFVTVYIGSFVLHREPSANCVEVHPRGLDLRRRSLQTFPRVVLRKCGRFSSQYGRDNIKQVRPNIVPPILQSILFENIHMPAAALYLGFRFLDNVAVTFGSLGPAGPEPVDIFLYDSRKRRDISEENLLSDSFRAALRRHNHFLFLHILAGAEVAKKTEGASAIHDEKRQTE
jgi:hypothetical protein